MAAKVTDPVALTAEAARTKGDLPYVDATKNYRAVIQVGARTRWRTFCSGEWKQESSGQGVTRYRHHPALHETGPISGAILNGLIGHHNRWLAFNRENKMPEGDVSRQLLVLSYNVTDEAAEDVKLHPGSPDYISKLIRETVQASVESVLAALQKNQKAAG